jgi:hypothetical protein
MEGCETSWNIGEHSGKRFMEGHGTLEGDGRMEGSRIFLTSTVYNKLTLRFKEKQGYPPPPFTSTPF